MSIGSYVDPRMAQGVRTLFNGMMPHTYTRVPTTPGTTNGWSETSRTPGTPLVGRPCRYAPRVGVEVTGEGFVLRREPPISGAVIYREVLLLPWDDDLAPDDLVQDIRSQEGTLLLAGPVPAVAVMAHAGLGPVTNRIAILRGAADEEPPQ